jgi:CRP/FNR family transcriptional regulator, anaerobic regulatory protein
MDHLHRCQRCVVRKLAVCGAMSDEQLNCLNEIAHYKKYAAGQTIISSDQPVTLFANIVSGTIKLTKVTADGREQIVGLLFASDFLGRTFGRTNRYFAMAATDVELCIFPSDAFERLIATFPDLKQCLFERTLDDLDAARDWMLLLGRKSAAERVASFLLLLARRFARSPQQAGAEFDMPLKRADMADYLGLTVETVSRQMTRLKATGIIEIKGTRGIKLFSMARLADAAGQSPSD